MLTVSFIQIGVNDRGRKFFVPQQLSEDVVDKITRELKKSGLIRGRVRSHRGRNSTSFHVNAVEELEALQALATIIAKCAGNDRFTFIWRRYLRGYDSAFHHERGTWTQLRRVPSPEEILGPLPIVG